MNREESFLVSGNSQQIIGRYIKTNCKLKNRFRTRFLFPGFPITNGCVAYFDFVRQSILSYHITDSDFLLTTIADSEIIKLTASAGSSAVETFDTRGKAVYEGKNIKIVAKELNGNDILHGPDLCVYIENNSEKNITVIVGDLSVNRFMAGGIFFL